MGRISELILIIILIATSVDLSALNIDTAVPLTTTNSSEFSEAENISSADFFISGSKLSPLKAERKSPYHDLIRTVAHSQNFDWVMLTAIVAQESNFDPSAKSWAGAVGLMQILPRYSQVSDIDRLFEPEINLKEGVRKLKKYLQFYDYMDPVNKWSFALATYNAGIGHIRDARRLTMDSNLDPNQWEYVSESLLQLMQRKYYRNARFGYCNGTETYQYVDAILNRYRNYKKNPFMGRSMDTKSVFPNWMQLPEVHNKLP